MIKSLLKKIEEQHIYTLILIPVIYILLGLASYASLNGIDKNKSMYVNSNKLDLKAGMYVENNEEYISLEDITNKFSENTFYDKISRKLVIIANNKTIKIADGDKEVVAVNDKLWYNIKYIANELGYIVDTNDFTNSLYITNNNYIDAKLLNGRIDVYDNTTTKIIATVYPEAKVQVMQSEKLNNVKDFVNVKVTVGNDVFFGRVLKNNIQYTYIPSTSERVNSSKVIMVCTGDKLEPNTDITKINTLSFNMLRLADKDLLVEEKYTLPDKLTKDIEVFAIISNGYTSSNFDSGILTDMLNSDTNKEKVIKQIKNYITSKKLAGVIINFKDYKVQDGELLEKFILELVSNIHAIDKKIIINVSDKDNIDVLKLSKAVDYIIVQAYGSRTTSSKISGSHSSVPFVNDTISSLVNKGINVNKLVLEIAPYSILWIEKAGIAIDSEIYYMDACNEYVKKNNLKVETDNNSKQHYINYTKGIITYKMWLEDDYSITNKLKIVSSMKLAGISIYRSGYENKGIYDIIKNEVN